MDLGVNTQGPDEDASRALNVSLGIRKGDELHEGFQDIELSTYHREIANQLLEIFFERGVVLMRLDDAGRHYSECYSGQGDFTYFAPEQWAQFPSALVIPDNRIAINPWRLERPAEHDLMDILNACITRQAMIRSNGDERYEPNGEYRCMVLEKIRDAMVTFKCSEDAIKWMDSLIDKNRNPDSTS